jgi:hypothetical protein
VGYINGYHTSARPRHDRFPDYSYRRRFLPPGWKDFPERQDPGMSPDGSVTGGILRGIETGWFTGEIADAAFGASQK